MKKQDKHKQIELLYTIFLIAYIAGVLSLAASYTALMIFGENPFWLTALTQFVLSFGTGCLALFISYGIFNRK